jgi:hypothetical protein
MTASCRASTRSGRATCRPVIAVLGAVLLAGCQTVVPEPWPTPTDVWNRPEPIVGMTWSNLTPVNGVCLSNDSWDLTSGDPYSRLEPIECDDERALFTIHDVGDATCSTGAGELGRKETRSGVGYCVGVIIAPGKCFPRRGDVENEDPDVTGEWLDVPIPCDARVLPPVSWSGRVSEKWGEGIARVTSASISKDSSWSCPDKVLCVDNSCKYAEYVWCAEILPLGET